MVQHKGVVNRLLWMQHSYLLGPLDAVLQKTPFGFDVSVWEFFSPLLLLWSQTYCRATGRTSHKIPPTSLLHNTSKQNNHIAFCALDAARLS